MARFTDKTVLVTGASAGIGAAVARRFADEGATLVLAARGRPALDALAATLTGQVEVVPTDVGDVDQCLALVDAAVHRTGRLDVLVNNAGLHHRGPFASQDARDLAAMIDVNLRGPLVLTRAALPHLEAAGGAVVNVASLAGFVPLPDAATYSATKAGLRFLSRALAEEHRGGRVRFALVSPGPVSTGFILDDLDHVSDVTFAQPMSSPEQVAELVLACAADGAIERVRPAVSAMMATLAYLAPWLGRAVRPAMERRGRRAKAAWRAKQA